MAREYPIIWIIGATRSCKSALAEHGVAPLGFKLIATANYFRERFDEADTYSRDFVFRLSDFAAGMLQRNPGCHADHLQCLIEEAAQPCVIEGERNPIEFAKLYDPRRDMVIFLNREDMEAYDTTIERGIPVIEQQVRWCVNNGIAPVASVFKTGFGREAIKGEYFGVNNERDFVFAEGPVKERKPEGAVEDRYPWINILIGLVREHIAAYYGDILRPASPPNKAEKTCELVS